MGNSKASLLDLMLEVDHKQGSAFSYDIIFVSRISERMVKACRSQTIHRVDCNFQCLCQISCSGFVRQILSQSTIQHLLCFIKLLMLDSDTSLKNIIESLGVFGSKQVFSNDTARMHRSNVKQSNVAVHTRLSVHITAFAYFFSTINRFAGIVCITRENRTLIFVKCREFVIIIHTERQISIRVEDGTLITHEAIVELLLRFSVITKDDLGSQ